MNLFCNLNNNWSLVIGSRPFILSIKRDWVRQKQSQSLFYSLSKHLFFFLHVMVFFGGGGVYLPKLKKGLGPASAAHFLDDFSIKSVLYLIKCSLSISFSVMPFFLFKISFFRQLISLFRLFRQLIISQISKFIFNHPLKQWLTREKIGKGSSTKI